MLTALIEKVVRHEDLTVDEAASLRQRKQNSRKEINPAFGWRLAI